MRKVALSFVLILSTLQILHAQKGVFIRLYDRDNKKINKGFFWGTTDSSVLFYKGNQLMEVPSDAIDHLRTKRSKCHRIIFTAVGVAVFAIVVVAVVANKDGNNRRIGNRSSGRNRHRDHKIYPKIPSRILFHQDTVTWRDQRLMMDSLLVK